MLQLRQDLPDAGHRGARLRRLRAHGRQRHPLRSSDSILWTVKFRNGALKRFKFPIRTTPEGTAAPDGGFATGSDDMNSRVLFTEPASSGLAEVPTVQKLK